MQIIYRIVLSLLLALQLSLASAVPSWAHVSGELAGGSAAGATSIKTVTSADASKYGLQKSSGSNTLYDEATGINYAVGKDGLIYEVSSLSGFNSIPLSKPLTSATNRGGRNTWTEHLDFDTLYSGGTQGNRNSLRNNLIADESLSLENASGFQAHHLVPWEQRKKTLNSTAWP